MTPPRKPIDDEKLDRIVAEARRHADRRAEQYRERALAMYPWVCGRCGREFNRENLRELTVHHRDHDHDNNPPDGSNWELLCVYCHDNEHSRHLDEMIRAKGGLRDSRSDAPAATWRPFEALRQRFPDKD